MLAEIALEVGAREQGPSLVALDAMNVRRTTSWMIQWGLICGCSFLGPQDEPREKSEQRVLEAEQADLFLGRECGLDPARATELCTNPSGYLGWPLELWVGCAQV